MQDHWHEENPICLAIGTGSAMIIQQFLRPDHRIIQSNILKEGKKQICCCCFHLLPNSYVGTYQFSKKIMLIIFHVIVLCVIRYKDLQLKF